MRGSPVSWMIANVWMWLPCLSPDAKLHEPVTKYPPSVVTADPGLVPWPAILREPKTRVRDGLAAPW